METDTAQLKRSCKNFKKILRSLPPNPARPNSLEFGREDYNPHILDTELIRLGIQLHHINIETGSISPDSPPAKTFFLPRPDFPDISDAGKQDINLNDVWGDAMCEEHEPKDEKKLFSDEPELFALDLVLTFEEYSFEGNRGWSSFCSRRFPEAVQPSRYGWIYDQ